MPVRLIPGSAALVALGVLAATLLVALLAGVEVTLAMRAALIGLLVLVIAIVADYATSRRAWRSATPTMTRQLPTALALAVQRPVFVSIETPSHPRGRTWQVELYDHADRSLLTDGLPARLTVAEGTRVEFTYLVTPTIRGEVNFAPADVRVRSRWRLCDLLEHLGPLERRRVYPDFAQVARYAWLAGDHRLQEIGIKTFQQRGQGTDFKQLAEYRVGDSLRHIDWRATQRLGKPIVRQFQDERDQCVRLLIDCGRRMRADDRQEARGKAHFDHVLNAVMLLTYVALRQGDAVGALTFGTPPGQARSFEPAKGVGTLNALMGQLYDVQPTLTHADYVGAAQELLRKQRKRALIVIITNFRDEASTELGYALRLLRTRHLVLLASLRERIVSEMASQALAGEDAAIEVASAHLYEQSTRDAFHRLASRDALMVSTEPERLGIELVNRYHALKRAGTI